MEHEHVDHPTTAVQNLLQMSEWLRAEGLLLLANAANELAEAITATYQIDEVAP